MLRAVVIFVVVAVLHFGLSMVGIALVLPAAFESQGVGFWAAPGKIVLVWISSALLAPVAWMSGSDFGLVDVAVASALFGVAAIGIARLGRGRRP